MRHGAMLMVVPAALSIAALWTPAVAKTGGQIYAGKTISLVVGSAPGGIFDLGGRLMAKYLTKYIPGHPAVVVENKPGASSVVAAEYMYNVAPRDGSVIATLQPTIVLNKNLDPKLKYNPGDYTWIGRVQPIIFAGVGWRASGVNSIDDARARTVIVSAQGAAGISAIMPWALNKLAGTKFKVITGYKSEGPAFVAMERGEVQGIGSAALTDVLEQNDWMAHKKVSILYTITQKRSSLSPSTPSIPELAQNEEGRKVLSVLGEGMDFGQLLMAPPKIPAVNRKALREAFGAMVNDPEFKAQAKKLGINVDPMNGEQLERLSATVSQTPDAVLEDLRKATRPQ